MNKLIVIIILTLTFCGSLTAHEKHKHNEKQVKLDTLTIVGKDTIAINGVLVTNDSLKRYISQNQEQNGIAVHEEEEEEHQEESLFSGLFHHMHNKLVHFPIAYAVLIFLFLVMGYKVEVCKRATKIIYILGVIFSIATVLTGLQQTAPFENTGMSEFVEIHKIIGISLTIVFGFLGWSIWAEKSKIFQLVIATILLMLALTAGYFGGIIAH